MILRNDDLAGVGIIGIFYGMTKDADDSDHLADFLHTVRDVAGVTDELFAACNLQKTMKNNIDYYFVIIKSIFVINKYTQFLS